MKTLRITVGLLVVGAAALPGRGQESVQQQEPASQAASEQIKVQPKDAVPEKIVAEKEAIEQLVGDYRIVSGEKSGEQVLPERLADVTVRFTEKSVTTYDGEKHERFSASYRLDTQQRPWRIRMTPAARPATAAAPQNGAGASPVASTSEGLIELVEGRVKIIYALPGGATPRAFETAERQQMFVLEKLPDPTEKPKASAAPSSIEEGEAAEKSESK